MLTGQKRHQVDAIWDAIHAGGIANPIQVIEQLTYLLFLKRLDENQLKAEEDAQLLGGEVESPTFTTENRDLRWHVLKQKDPADIFAIIRDRAFPFIKTLGGENSTLSRHMENAIFLWPSAGLLARVVEMLDGIEMHDSDTKGDLYEYMLAKLSQGGQNGQFRTPRHIIAAMVEMTAPQPADVICDPACGTAGFLVMAGEY
ncbi:MAG: N-6 DNA methylase, partial [Armatimonadetes bacterium]|nr:N-6 DNA methylase [Armatimonadota bacterium]